MKNKNMKKVLSFVLAMVMVLSMFAVTASAAEEVTSGTRSQDFESQTVGSSYVRSGWTFNSGNKYVKVSLNQNHWVYPMNFMVTSFKITFDMMIPTNTGSNFYGFYFYTNALDNDDYKEHNTAQITCHIDASDKAYFGNGVGTSVDVTSICVDKWCTVEIVRDGEQVEARIWEKGGERPDTAMVTNTVPEGKNVPICPAWRWQERDTSVDNCIYLDNLVATTPYEIYNENDTTLTPSAGTTLVETDFENDVGLNDAFTTGGVSSSATVDKGVMQETDNNYYAVTYKKAGTGTTNYNIYSTINASDSYVFSGDVRWETVNTSDYYGCYFASGNSGEQALMLLSQNNGVHLKRNSDSYGSAVSDSVVATQGTAWYSFEYTRVGNTVSFKLWEKGTQKPAVANATYTVNPAAAKPYITFSFAKTVALESTVSVDNLKITTLPTVDCVAAQTTGGLDANNQYAVRFIATVNSLDYAKAGFEIVATPANGDALQFEDSTNTVYNSIIASDELGIKAEYTAQELGGKYLIAIGIKEIPDGLGNVTFTVKPFCENSTGRIYGAEKTLTVNNGVAVIS